MALAHHHDVDDVEKSALDASGPVPATGAGGKPDQQQRAGVSSRNAGHRSRFASVFKTGDGEVYEPHSQKTPKWYQRIIDVGLEENGIKPVPLEERTDRQYWNLFTVMFTALMNLLPIPTGILATTVFGMSLRDASLTILFFSLLTSIPPAFMGIGGPFTGLRQQIQARYSFGLYLATIPLLLNAATVTGFSLIGAIIGGQSISALNPDGVSVDVGIVIVCLVSFAAGLMGYRAIHMFNAWTWVPNLISMVVMTGCAGKYLHLQSDVPPATVAQVLSYGGLLAGYFITFGGTISDYSVYHNPNVRKTTIFAYFYLGSFVPSIPLLVLGAAIGGAIPNVDSWNEAYSALGVGGVLYEILVPVTGGFGRFILVLLALSVIGNITISMYSVALNLQMLLPLFARVPRFIFILITTAIMIPLAIQAAKEWEESLENFLAVIGYWAGCFDAIVIEELVVFRRMDWSTFDHGIWNVGKKLPTGIPAILAAMISFALIVPGMAEVWYTGPIAETTGDIGFEMAFVVTALAYLPLRWLEIRWRGHL